ncbi:MAG: hypothetical protein DWQ37_16930 [Planctomycetota bacterium]|nr:MAG: hypothetical protein DWQ37_16930 [Planctomycetota bacterium]
MNQAERRLLWFVCSTLAAAALAWVAFQVQQEGIAPVVLFPVLVGALLGAAVAGVRQFTALPGRGTTIVAAVVLGLLVVAAQDYIGHRQRLRLYSDELRAGHPLAAAAAAEGDFRPTFVHHLQARLRDRPVWWTLDFVFTAAAAGVVAAIATRKQRVWQSYPGGDLELRQEA